MLFESQTIHLLFTSVRRSSQTFRTRDKIIENGDSVKFLELETPAIVRADAVKAERLACQ